MEERSPLLILKDKATEHYYLGYLIKNHIGIWCAFHNFDESHKCKYPLHETYSLAVDELVSTL